MTIRNPRPPPEWGLLYFYQLININKERYFNT